VLTMREKWLEAGLIPRDEMKTDCCYAVQDKAWVSDPDGNQWEVFVVLEDNLPEKAEAGVCCAPAVSQASEARTTAACSTEKASTVETSSCGCSS
jgi:hypothetical protein